MLDRVASTFKAVFLERPPVLRYDTKARIVLVLISKRPRNLTFRRHGTCPESWWRIRGGTHYGHDSGGNDQLLKFMARRGLRKNALGRVGCRETEVSRSRKRRAARKEISVLRRVQECQFLDLKMPCRVRKTRREVCIPRFVLR
jgi:hypothetical protein